jgi:hypothetical protein
MPKEFDSLYALFEELSKSVEQGVCPAGCGTLQSLGVMLGSEMKHCMKCGFTDAYPVRRPSNDIQTIDTIQ